MKNALKMLALLIALTLAVNAQAQEAKNPAPLGQAQTSQTKGIDLYKDPMLASYLSITIPGLGQIYAGEKKRGFLFLAGIVGAFGSAYAFYEPAELHLSDYDKTEFGGNGDGLLGTLEVKNWEDHKFEGDAFDRLSTGRKVGAIAGAVAGVGLYIWNVIDANKQAKHHNRRLAQRKFDLGLHAGPDRAGVALNMHF